jgi:hypothetical protein
MDLLGGLSSFLASAVSGQGTRNQKGPLPPATMYMLAASIVFGLGASYFAFVEPIGWLAGTLLLLGLLLVITALVFRRK